MTEQQRYVVHTPIFPAYSEVLKLLDIWSDTTSKADVLELINAVHDQTGTPQNPVDWSNPDEWINERLKGKNQQLAERIWNESSRAINPRHLYGSYLFVNTYKLLEPDANGIYRVSDIGQHFIDGDRDAVRKIDEDGDKLIELMLKHEVGIKKRTQALVEIDESYFIDNVVEVPSKAVDELGNPASE